MAHLVEVGGKSKRYELGSVTRIGRDPANEICLTDPMVSPRHAEIRAAKDGFRIVDLGSRRGTFLASRRVDDAALTDGDELLIGVARLRFEDDADGESVVEALFRLPAQISFRSASEIASVEELRRDHEKLRAAVELSRALG